MRFQSIVGSLLLMTASAASMAAMPSAAASPAADEADEAKRVQAANDQSVQDAMHGRYLDASFGLLAHLGVASATDIKDADVFDQWTQVMSCMTGMPTFNPAKTADFHVPKEQLADLRGAHGVSALAEIVRRARRTSIVILDENHLDPRGRAFALEVARALRPLGYTTLAVEALKRDADDAVSRDKMAALSKDGYVRQPSGYYLHDPVFADFLRQSLALGYRPVSYETTRTEYADDPGQAQAQREQDQADNLVRRALKQAPAGGKILIYAGEHHVAERPIAAEGGKVEMMAQRLKRATGIDPLTIDQAGLSPIPMNRPDADLYAIAEPKTHGRSVVLMRHGKPLTVGLLAGSVDLQVVHPRTTLVAGRPQWLEGMGRKPSPIPQALLPTAGTRLVQAFVEREGDDAIAVDQALVAPGTAAPALMLPSVPVRYAIQERDAR
ncbi:MULTISPECIES: energy-coupling factor ABC transporter ATP-binding protein [unclassified Xanthomonas]|uniref:hypothetical protein n=1 Tax=Xanthomonas sp. LMG 9002 TaxID=1591158 RepID=UPI0013699E9C|nr:hypothetical protein [Xanthomonas sp. LMG 9002]